MIAILITGNPGSGKTTLATELTRRECCVIDGDDIAGWATTEGVPVEQPGPIPADWWEEHRWVWTRAHGRPVFEAQMRDAGGNRPRRTPAGPGPGRRHPRRGPLALGGAMAIADGGNAMRTI